MLFFFYFPASLYVVTLFGIFIIGHERSAAGGSTKPTKPRQPARRKPRSVHNKQWTGTGNGLGNWPGDSRPNGQHLHRLAVRS